ncbi:hypothetical protein [Bartonella sp. OT172YNZD]|uniref:hypothetical protein n=1 Tax=Bartonella sp. OT172YNZD TaxID=3243572 RepID=UPI0035D09280
MPLINRLTDQRLIITLRAEDVYQPYQSFYFPHAHLSGRSYRPCGFHHLTETNLFGLGVIHGF